jgi:polyhydroxyalkanoate synthesis regulator phasin
MKMSEDIRKLMLAGLGAASVASEKTGEAIDELAKRGEEALAHGKDLNERLRHEIEQTIKDQTPTSPKDEVFAALNKLTPEERKAIREKLDQMGDE